MLAGSPTPRLKIAERLFGKMPSASVDFRMTTDAGYRANRRFIQGSGVAGGPLVLER